MYDSCDHSYMGSNPKGVSDWRNGAAVKRLEYRGELRVQTLRVFNFLAGSG